MPKSFLDFQRDCETLTMKIREAEDALFAGQPVNIAPMQGAVQTLCLELKQADSSTAKLLQPLIAEIISALGSLAERLQDRQSG